jgi:hypothetical protein
MVDLLVFGLDLETGQEVHAAEIRRARQAWPNARPSSEK